MSGPDLVPALAASLYWARAKKIQQRKMMTDAIVKVDPGKLAASVVVHGDLSGLNDNQLRTYYQELCSSLDLNPLTRPFSLLKLNGKLLLYANRDCTDQLRAKHSVSIRIVNRERMDDMIVVTAQAALPNGRMDESIGAVPCGGNIKGEALANAMMKAETKAKRRVALSICGLGFMDESEVDGAIAGGGGFREPEAPALSLSPHADSREEAAGDADLFADLLHKLEAVKSELPHCDSYDKALSLRNVIGSGKVQSELLRRIQEGKESGALTASMSGELGKLWQHCHRQVTKLEEKHKPPLESTFVDDPDPRSMDDGHDEMGKPL